MHGHVQALDDDKAAQCPHPQCVVSFDSVQDLQHHLQDLHCVTLARVLKRCRSDPAPEDEDVRVKRPRRAAGCKAYGDDFKSRPKGSPQGIKSIEDTRTPNREGKYTFITSTAEAFQSSSRSSVIPKTPGRETEQRTMTGQCSGSVAQEYPLSMDDQVEISVLDVGNRKLHISITPSVKSDFLQCIDPRLLEISDAMQQCTQPTDILPQSVRLTEAGPRMAQCPVCRTEVDADFLEQYTNGETRVKLRAQMAFCMAHKKKTAVDEWVSHNYPAIIWDFL